MRNYAQSLIFRVAVMLTVALLPVGIIALMQTANVARQASELNRSALFGRTVSDVEDMRELLHGGFASARVLATSVVGLRDDPAACSELMRQLVDRSVVYTLATFIDTENRSECNSRGEPYDLEGSSVAAQMEANRVPMAELLERGRISGLEVMVLAYPVYQDGVYLGFVSISIEEDDLSRREDSVGASATGEVEQEPIDLVTFTDEGRVLMSDLTQDQLDAELPQEVSLKALVGGGVTAFSGESQTGEARVYTLVPIIPGLVHAMAIWEDEAPDGLNWYSAALFPILMWVISLGVAYIAVHRLVLVHIRRLRSRMIRFAAGHRSLNTVPDVSRRAPSELREMNETFESMAETILHDEAELENGIHEKNLLLREVHHRVKNNLQLIASIMNMEIRKATGEEARTTLRRILDRVLGLATVHSSLYQTSRLSVVHADALLNAILRQTLSTALPKDAGVTPKMEIEDLTIAPDQAVPISLLTTEAVTNATKHMGHPDGPGSAWLTVELEELDPVEDSETGEMGPPRARLTVANSIGEPLTRDFTPPSSNGLGSQLIRAFAAQLGGKLEVVPGEEEFRLAVTFPIEEQPEGEPEAEIAPGERTVPPRSLPREDSAA
ncbi:sensor histidine kinase [Vannielia litorea]|uniref:sensor histidine kinase n=1 Tax=Vannielia litorea TaxID=1217970 RepID=UPI001C989E31|nr:sensor histidine kinase [Vannielia litorea]MBY6046958.1 sensor histidine kinase [Vannielia litorea]MBY6074372.1 sensor histidine kinase [Vannielia litorea]